MRKFALLAALFVALLMVSSSWIHAEHQEGHLDFGQQPWLSEAAVDNDSAGTTPIMYMIDLGVDSVEIIPDFKIRIVNVWASIEVTDVNSYTVQDGEFGFEVTNSFNTTTTGIQQVKTLDVNFSEIDPAAGESIFISTGGGTVAEGHIYILTARML